MAAHTGCRVVGVEGNKDEHNAAVARQQAFKAKVHSSLGHDCRVAARSNRVRPFAPKAAQGKRYKHARAELLCVDVLESVPAGLG